MNSSVHDILNEYKPAPEFSTRAAYFSMEFAIDQALKIYSGGLGFLAGSHMRSAYDLKQNVIGVGILWKNGYYDQARNLDGTLKPVFVEKHYSFLYDTEFVFSIPIHATQVHVKAFLLKPDTFGTAPLFLLSTDIPENDYLSRTISNTLYDNNTAARIAQSILLGNGGAKLLDLLGIHVDVYHMNEGHALPLAFYLYNKFDSKEEVRKRLVFTTHTPELAGNEEHPVSLLKEMTFFDGVPAEKAAQVAESNGKTINYTLTALKFSKRANAVSKLHKTVANKMWAGKGNIAEIIAITNAQNARYWTDPELKNALDQNNDQKLLDRKRELKEQLFKTVADQCGKLFDPDVLTIVWGRRFAGYKRAWLILSQRDEFTDLVTRKDMPIQMIWAGKPYPQSQADIDLFNYIYNETKDFSRCAVLFGYEMALSAALKKGSDLWLNTPRYSREASGTSGMTASMNGSLNFSIPDGWVPEFAKDQENAFLIDIADIKADQDERDQQEAHNMMMKLKEEIVPLYYQNKAAWLKMMKNAMKQIIPDFDSGRMAKEYYEKMYNYEQ